MSNRELISWRDVRNCVLAALAITLVICGGAYLGAGGPIDVAMASTSHQAQKPITIRESRLDASWASLSPTAAHRMAVSSKVYYRVKPGDYLGKIAARFYHRATDWPVIYWANHRIIHYPNNISAGQVLLIPALPTRIPAPPAVLAPSAPRPLTDAATSFAPQQKIVEQAAPVRTTTNVPSSSYSVSSSFQACVIRAESGGDAQIWNASGHYGLYQFSASTWAAYGGNPADFGHASAAEQTQVFDNAMATAGGANNWAPYDGC